jgi:hypothetical protein
MSHVTVSVTRSESVRALSTSADAIMAYLNVSLARLRLVEELSLVVIRSCIHSISESLTGRNNARRILRFEISLMLAIASECKLSLSGLL